jgi:hypothetical protein
MFWRTSFYWSIDALRFPWLASGLNLTIQIQRVILFIVNLLFIFTSLYYALSELISTFLQKTFSNRIYFVNPGKKAYVWLVLGTIWIASILQTLLDHGDNPRFLVPLQSLVVLWVALFFYQILSIKHTESETGPERTRYQL